MIPIKNVYYMLSYAFKVLQQDGYRSIETEEFDNALELYSAILEKSLSIQIKRGLHRTYIEKTQVISTIRGKIDISEGIKSGGIYNRKLTCTFDDFSTNSYVNRIIKTTLVKILHSDISSEQKHKIRKLIPYFDDVDIINTRDINWNLRLDKNNKTNRMILSICKLVIDGFLQSEKDGKIRLEHFSESNMPALYEHFILEYYRKHFPELNASPSFVDWNSDDGIFDLLPRMRTDITLTSEDKVLIIDAKYYSHSLQENSLYSNKKSIHSGNMYQIYSYVKNKDVEHSGKVSGMLLYAKTDEEISPNQEYMLDGNRFIVRTLDLNRDFAEIAENLNTIAKLILE